MRVSVISGAALVAFLAMTAPAAAQFGIGGRFSFIKPDVEADVDSQRFTGGQIRIKSSPHIGLEVSLDVHSETNEAETLRIRNYPLQFSLLVFPVRTVFSPYLLGGGGWYSQKVETLAGDETIAEETQRDFGWHAGFGAELSLGKHVGLHGDYRYTKLDFNDDEQDNQGLLGRFLPAYRGSMWTVGLTVYF